MPKVEIEIPPSMYEILCDVAKALGLSVEKLAEQELCDSLCNADVWLQRAEMIV
jgi:hypothetical protein